MGHRHSKDEGHQQPIDDWFCPRCFEIIDSSRPPGYNPNNCACAEVGTPVNDPHLAAQLIDSIKNMRLNQDIPSDAYQFHPAPTVSSDNCSVKAPEGPESQDPNNTVLPVAPATGLNEIEHRRTASFDDLIDGQVNFILRRFLNTMAPHERLYYGSGRVCHDPERGPWLRQDVHLVGPTGGGGHSFRAATGSNEESMESSFSMGSGSQDINPTEGTGNWMNGVVIEAWPDTLMIDDCAVEEDDDEE